MTWGVDPEELAQLEERLLFLARRKYRIPRATAVDLVQATLLAFLEGRHRYPNNDEHPRILVGIFRNKCREHIERSVRASRGLDALRLRVAAEQPTTGPIRTEGVNGDGVLGEMVRRESGRQVAQALASLRPKAREMFRLITEDGLDRGQLMQRMGLNANTLDSRLHTYRKELRRLLDGRPPRRRD